MKTLKKIALGMTMSLLLATSAQAEGRTISIITDATFMPFEFMQDGEMTGFDIDLVDALAKQMGDKVEWTQIDFKGLIPGLVAKRYDAAVSAIYITDARKKVVDFTNTYYPGGLVILTKSDNSDINGPTDLAGKKVSVQVGTKSVAYLKSNYPEAILVEVEKNTQMFDLLKIGRVDATVTGKPAAIVYAKINEDVRVLPEQITTEEYGIAVRKDMPELTADLNKAILALKADGTYDALVTKWFGNVK